MELPFPNQGLGASRTQNSPEMSCSRNVLHSFHGPGDGLATCPFSCTLLTQGTGWASCSLHCQIQSPFYPGPARFGINSATLGVEVNSASPFPAPSVAKSPLRWLLLPELKVPAGSCHHLPSARHSWIWGSLWFALPRTTRNSIRHHFPAKRSIIFQPGMEALGWSHPQEFAWPHPKPTSVIPSPCHLPFPTGSGQRSWLSSLAIFLRTNSAFPPRSFVNDDPMISQLKWIPVITENLGHRDRQNMASI